MLTPNHQEIDLGNIKFGKTYNLRYTLTNNYDKILTITKVYTGCASCTKASATRKILAPKESADITAEFTPGSKGIQSKQVYIAHMIENYQVKPDLVLKIKAVVSE